MNIKSEERIWFFKQMTENYLKKIIFQTKTVIRIELFLQSIRTINKLCFTHF